MQKDVKIKGRLGRALPSTTFSSVDFSKSVDVVEFL